MILRRTMTLVLLLGICLTLGSCATDHATSVGRATPPVDDQTIVVQLKWFHQFQFAGFYAAIEQGYYQEAGLDVRLMEGDPGLVPDTFEEVLAGRAQYGVTNSEIVLRRAQGDPVVVLAAILQHSPLTIAVRHDSGMNTPQQLAGRSLMLPPSIRAAELHAMFRNEGVDLERMTLLGPPDNYPDYLFDQTIDGFSVYRTNEPFLLEKAGIPITFIEPRSYGIDFYGDLIYTTEAEIRNHPERVQAFRDATLRGWEYAMDNPAEIADLIIVQYGADKPREHLLFEAEQMRSLMMPELIEIGHMNPGRWQHIADVYATLGMMDPQIDLKPLLYDPAARANSDLLYRVLTAAGVLFGVLAIGAVVLLAVNRRLQVLVDRRTGELKQLNRELRNEIQERIAAEHSLRDSRARFQTVWEVSSDAMALSDKDGMVLAVNPAYVELYGYPEDQLVNHDFAVIFPNSVREWAREQYQEVFQGSDGCHAPFESQIQRSDGSARVVESRTGFITVNGERAAMLSTIRDITERKAAEDELRRQAQIISWVGQAVVMADNHGRIEFWNPAAVRLFGWEDDSLRGVDLWQATRCSLSNDQRQAIEQALQDGDEWTAEARMGRKDGMRFPALLSVAPILDSDQIQAGMVLSASDLTELRQLEERYQIAQRMEAIGTLAGGVAHDFNNVLTPIISYAELSRLKLQVDHPIQQYITEILRASNRAKELVQQILTFSRQLEHQCNSVDVCALARETAKLLRSTIPTTIDLQLNICAEQATIWADPAQVHQVILNLITNAYQAIGENQGVIRVDIDRVPISSETSLLSGTLASGLYVRLIVRDSGSGIDNQHLARLFDPFFTTKPVGKGTGLGLSVTHGIVQSLGGAIDIKTTPGEGTHFAVYLPYFEMDMDQPMEQQGRSDPNGSERVLVVDDNLEVLDAICEILEAAGYQVSGTTDSVGALHRLLQDEEEVDLILCDQVMPGLTGDEFVSEVRTTLSSVPIILLSGYSERVGPQDTERLGIQTFLYKPFQRDLLLRTVREVLDEAGSANEAAKSKPRPA